MHIAIEGMDGAGKTSQAKALAKRLNCDFIPKSFHEMNDTSGKYDNFVTIDEYTHGEIKGVYGLRKKYYLLKSRNQNIVTDRFYISNYWSRAEAYNTSYFKEISYVWGKPDLMIILYAKPEILYRRIYLRDSHDKDLWKPGMAERGYQLMKTFAAEMLWDVLVIDTSELSFDETTGIIMHAVEHGIKECCTKFPQYCSVIEPEAEIKHMNGAVFRIKSGELLQCNSENEEIILPKEIKYIGESCFKQCKHMKKLVLNSCVEKISDFAFDGISIEEISVSEDNPYFENINNFLLDKRCKKLLKYFCGNGTNAAILPKDIRIIGNRAFSQCHSIEKIVCPADLREIQYGAFFDCDALKTVVISGDKLCLIRDGIFMGCKSIELIDFAGNEYYINEDRCIKTAGGVIVAFLGYYIGDEYKVPECTYICPYAYSGRLNVRRLVLPDLTVKIGSHSFQNCKIKEICIGTDIKEIGEESFKNTGAERLFLNARHIPEVWENSFDKDTEIDIQKAGEKDYIFHRGWKGKNISETLLEKPSNMPCGSACLKYLIFKKENKIVNVPDMYWIIDLANYIRTDFGFNVCIEYYKSKLMEDYYLQSCRDKEISDAIDNYLSDGGTIRDKEAGINLLSQYTEQYEYVILNARSDILFDDKNMTGQNHYIILEAVYDGTAVIISPGRQRIFRRWITAESLMNMINGNGQWRLLIGEKNE